MKKPNLLSLNYIMFMLFSFFISSQAFAHGMSEADKAKALEASNWEYVWLCATHMLKGYDHLLFLFGVIFFLTKFKDIVKFITIFTIGHSITLIFATFYEIKANYFLIDAVIALTVCYKGFDNLDGFKKYLNVRAPNLLMMVFAFGLIHGFGLSTRLQQLPLADEGLLLRIISFNVGVEVGQIIALTIMLFALKGWRATQSFNNFAKASNVGLIIVGFLLLLMQLHGYNHTKYPDEYPLNADDHFHIHKKIDEEKAQANMQDAIDNAKLLEDASQQTSTEEYVEPVVNEAPKPKKQTGGHSHGDVYNSAH